MTGLKLVALSAVSMTAAAITSLLGGWDAGIQSLLLSGNHGLFCFDLKCGDRFLSELAEVIACYQS